LLGCALAVVLALAPTRCRRRLHRGRVVRRGLLDLTAGFGHGEDGGRRWPGRRAIVSVWGVIGVIGGGVN